MIKLTTAQREALLVIVAHQDKAGQELVFWCHPRTVPSAASEEPVYVFGKNRDVIVEMPPEYVFLWQELGLVIIGNRGGSAFILRQEALDYAAEASRAS